MWNNGNDKNNKENSDINDGKSNDKNYDKNNVLSKFGSFLWFHREIWFLKSNLHS